MGALDEGKWLDTVQSSERVVARLLPPESSPVDAVSQTVGISRWDAGALAGWIPGHTVR